YNSIIDIDFHSQYNYNVYEDIGGGVMPLTMLPLGREATIDSCNAKAATRKFLEGLGLVPGATVSVISDLNGSLIVNIKGARVALNRGVAQQLNVKM
ncbi:MAG TPA: FeoA family protein, partial [Clostridia bacterium]|nr:FeoA family protein [Clostridia bacterium]